MMGLYPLGSRELYGLNLMTDFLKQTIDVHDYVASNFAGQIMQSFSVNDIFKIYGSFQCFTRGTLINILRNACQSLSIRMGITLSSLTQVDNIVKVEFSDHSEGEYDLVVGADGLNSTVRQLAFSPNEYAYFNTGWGCWVWWADEPELNPTKVVEFWGVGKMLGIYPTNYKYGVVIASPMQKNKTIAYPNRRQDIMSQCQILSSQYPTLFSGIPTDDDLSMYYWPLSDVRSKIWYKNRVVLIGDAAVGFLPTAGIGASMAMESAGVLADELSRTNTTYINWALSLYQKRRQKRVEAIQNDSRKLAKYMFIKSPLLTKLRDFLLPYYSAKTIAKNIDKYFKTPI